MFIFPKDKAITAKWSHVARHCEGNDHVLTIGLFRETQVVEEREKKE